MVKVNGKNRENRREPVCVQYAKLYFAQSIYSEADDTWLAVKICDIIFIRDINMPSHLKPKRLNGLPEAMREELIEARHERGWSQEELGKRLGLPQMHISGIETGKIVPRFDTLLDLVRGLDRDLLMVPRALVPAVQALVRDHFHPDDRTAENDEGERPLYGSGAEPGEKGGDEK
jgi:transcriptional regulator with XRE-family HTH domain